MIETIKLTPQSCSLTPPKAKVEHKIKKFIRRFKESVAPTHCRIRFDTMVGKWAVLNNDNTSNHHFDYGVMTNVVFEVKHLSGYDPQRCSQINEYIGIAEGDLRENYYGHDATGFRHINFDKKSGAFLDAETNQPIARASILRPMTERRALYRP